MLNPVGTVATGVSTWTRPGVSVNTPAQSVVPAQSPGPPVGFKSSCLTLWGA